MDANNEESRKMVEDLTGQVAQISIHSQSRIHDQAEAVSKINSSGIKKIPISRQVQEENNDLEPPSLKFWGVSEDVEKLIPKESYVLVLNRHEYETDEGMMEMGMSKGNAFIEAYHSPAGALVANESSIQMLATWIQKSRRILVVSGAGVSVSAGIPDFRTKGTGLVRQCSMVVYGK